MKDTTQIIQKMQALVLHFGLSVEEAQVVTVGNNYFTMPTMAGQRRYIVLTKDEADIKMLEELCWRLYELDSEILLQYMPGIEDVEAVSRIKALFDDGHLGSIEDVNGVLLSFIGTRYAALVQDIVRVHGRGKYIAVDGLERLCQDKFYIYKKATREGGR